MTRHTTANGKTRKVRNDQEKLVTALRTLFDLLEDYAPHWYTQEHHETWRLRLSPQLAAKLRRYVEDRSADEPLFLSKKGKRSEPDNFVKRHLKPILGKLGLEGAAHAFRHGNATLLDSLRTSLRANQDRLGHADPKTTMLYTHAVSEDDRSTAEQLGALLVRMDSCPKIVPSCRRRQ